MSYILDALKKSEAKRQAQSVPPLLRHDVPQKSYGKRKALATVWGVIGLLGLMAAFGIGWQTGLLDGLVERLSTAESAQMEVVSSGQIRPQEAVPTKATQLAEVDLPDAVSQATKATMPISEIEQAITGDEENNSQPSEQANGKAVEATEPESDQTVPPEDARVRIAEPMQSMDGLASAESETSSVWTPSQPEYLQFWELPQAVQADLASVTLSVHVFARNAADRFVLINGRRYSEGDQVGEDLWVFAIREEGAILDYGDYRFLLTR